MTLSYRRIGQRLLLTVVGGAGHSAALTVTGTDVPTFPMLSVATTVMGTSPMVSNGPGAL